VAFRFAVVLLVLGFIGLLIVMGAISFVRWLRVTHPRHFRSILTGVCAVLIGTVGWAVLEVLEQPTFQPGDLVTVQEPLVARMVTTDVKSATTSCIVEIYEDLSVVGIHSGTMKARIESNKKSGPSSCPIGAEVQFELAWLRRYTLTHRQL